MDQQNKARKVIENLEEYKKILRQKGRQERRQRGRLRNENRFKTYEEGRN